MQRLLSRLTYSNVVSSLCLVLVLGGGTAFAAAKLGKNSVGTKQIKNGAVSAAKIQAGAIDGEKVADNSLTGADIKNSTLGTVPTADQARTATTAQSAQTAQSAKTADSADTAKTADSAKTAQSATTAQTANIASTASSAQTAGSAISAQTAKNAELAAKATLAESLNGHTPFSVNIGSGEREVLKLNGVSLRVSCQTNEGGKEIGKMIVFSEEFEPVTVAVAGKTTKTLGSFEGAEAFTSEKATGTSTASVGGAVTVVGPNGVQFSLSAPTIGFNLTSAHPEQCFFSGVIQSLPELPQQP